MNSLMEAIERDLDRTAEVLKVKINNRDNVYHEDEHLNKLRKLQMKILEQAAASAGIV